MPTRHVAVGFALCRLMTWFLAFGLLKHLVPIRLLARWAWRTPRGLRDRAREHEIVSRILQAGRISGAPDRDCLQRSLLLYRELSAARANPRLRIGFVKDGGQLRGHAWVVVDGRPVAERAEDLARFTPSAEFGRKGVASTAVAEALTGV